MRSSRSCWRTSGGEFWEDNIVINVVREEWIDVSSDTDVPEVEESFERLEVASRCLGERVRRPITIWTSSLKVPRSRFEAVLRMEAAEEEIKEVSIVDSGALNEERR